MYVNGYRKISISLRASLQVNVNYRPLPSNIKFIDYRRRFKISRDTKTSFYEKRESSHKISLGRYFPFFSHFFFLLFIFSSIGYRLNIQTEENE